MTGRARAYGQRVLHAGMFIAAVTLFAAMVPYLMTAWSPRVSRGAIFVVGYSVLLLAFVLGPARYGGRFASVMAFATSFVPVLLFQGGFRMVSAAMLAPPALEWLVLAFVGVCAFAAPSVALFEKPLDRVVRVALPTLAAAALVAFVVALAHARRPDPDEYVDALPPRRALSPTERLTVGHEVFELVSRGDTAAYCEVVDGKGEVRVRTECLAEVKVHDADGVAFVRAHREWVLLTGYPPPVAAVSQHRSAGSI